MAKDTEDTRIPEACRNCLHWQQVEDRVRLRALLTSLIEKLESELLSAKSKPTIADLIKVMEARKNLAPPEKGAVELSVRWADRTTTPEN